MQQQQSSGTQESLDDIARRHGFSRGAVDSMLESVRRGNGTMAQFSHPEFSGSGQWMRGGMTMVSDMFNKALASRVDALCTDLAHWLDANPRRDEPAHGGSGGSPGGTVSSGSQRSRNWWPDEFSNPSSSGSQNDMRYAYFPDARRLAVEVSGTLSVYDTGEHRIGGVSQQQSGSQSLTFSSQRGQFSTLDLPLVSRGGGR